MIGVYDQLNRRIFFIKSSEVNGLPQKIPPSGKVICTTDSVFITPGLCLVNIAILSGGQLSDHIIHAGDFEVIESDFFNTGRITSRQDAICITNHKWNFIGPANK